MPDALSSQPLRCDVAVLGAGAAGLLAAYCAAERGRTTVLLEKNRRPGAKILISGGTRCNVTSAAPIATIVEAFGRNGRFLRQALGRFSNDDLRLLLEGKGLALKVEQHGDKQKVFPVSNRAVDVLNTLLGLVEASGARLECQRPATDIQRRPEGFAIDTPSGPVLASSVIVTTGGASFPRSGTCGDGYEFVRALGHSLVTPVPALVPLLVAEPWVHGLAGVTLPDVAVEARGAGKRLDRRRGGLLFTHFGVSGPVVLDISRPLAKARQQDLEPLELALDLLPDAREENLDRDLREAAQRHAKRGVAGLLPAQLPARLREALVAVAGVDPGRVGVTLRREERRALVATLKRCALPVESTRGFDHAEVTSGGVALSEVDPRTCQSRLVKGLFLAGELLDLDGLVGGYNFQAAFSTGWLAGSCA